MHRDWKKAALECFGTAKKGAQRCIDYRFGEAVIDDADLSLSSDGINIPGFAREIVFAKENPWADMASAENGVSNKPQTAEID